MRSTLIGGVVVAVLITIGLRVRGEVWHHLPER